MQEAGYKGSDELPSIFWSPGWQGVNGETG